MQRATCFPSPPTGGGIHSNAGWFPRGPTGYPLDLRPGSERIHRTREEGAQANRFTPNQRVGSHRLEFPSTQPVPSTSKERGDAPVKVICPQCSSFYSKRAPRHGGQDFLCRLIGWFPWRCRECHHRFYVHRRMKDGTFKTWGQA